MVVALAALCAVDCLLCVTVEVACLWGTDLADSHTRALCGALGAIGWPAGQSCMPWLCT